jgi:3D (Asp-Asp-Asp) domain-containing protein
MALSSNRELKFYASQELIDVPVDDNVNIYKGAFVGANSSTGYARPLTADDDFLGVAYKQADNTVSGHTAGGITVRLHQSVDIVHTLSGVAATDIGSVVYASDDGTLTLTSTGNSRVGRIVAIEGTNLVRVRCHPIASLSS